MGGMLHLHIDGPFTQVQLVLIPNVAVEPPVPTSVGAQRAQRKTRYFHRWSEARSTDPGSLCDLCELCGQMFEITQPLRSLRALRSNTPPNREDRALWKSVHPRMYVVLAGRAWYFAESRVGTEAGDHQGAEPERSSLTAKRAKDAKRTICQTSHRKARKERKERPCVQGSEHGLFRGRSESAPPRLKCGP